MKKRMMIAAAALAMLMSVTALAENTLSAQLEAMTGETAETQTAETAQTETAAGANVGPAVTASGEGVELVRSSVYLVENKYGNEIRVFAELKNVSGKTLYPDAAALNVLGADGAVLEEEDYCYRYPAMVGDGESFFVWDMLNDPEYPLDSVAGVTLVVENEDESYTDYIRTEADGWVENGIAGVEVTNTTDATVYAVEATLVVSGENGEILDVMNTGTGNAIGLKPGSTMILRDNAEDYTTGKRLTRGTCRAYVTYEHE